MQMKATTTTKTTTKPTTIERALDALRADGAAEMTIKEVAKAIDVHPDSARKALGALYKDGRATRTEGDGGVVTFAAVRGTRDPRPLQSIIDEANAGDADDGTPETQRIVYDETTAPTNRTDRVAEAIDAYTNGVDGHPEARAEALSFLRSCDDERAVALVTRHDNEEAKTRTVPADATPSETAGRPRSHHVFAVRAAFEDAGEWGVAVLLASYEPAFALLVVRKSIAKLNGGINPGLADVLKRSVGELQSAAKARENATPLAPRAPRASSPSTRPARAADVVRLQQRSNGNRQIVAQLAADVLPCAKGTTFRVVVAVVDGAHVVTFTEIKAGA